MEPTDITIEILKSIREELRGTRTELSEELRGSNARLDGLEFGLREGLSTLREGISTLPAASSNPRCQPRRRSRTCMARCATCATCSASSWTCGRVSSAARDIGELRQQISDR